MTRRDVRRTRIRYFRYNFSDTVVNKSVRLMAEMMRAGGVRIYLCYLIVQSKRIMLTSLYS